MSKYEEYSRLAGTIYVENDKGEVVASSVEGLAASLAMSRRTVARTSVSVRDTSRNFPAWTTYTVSTVFLSICHGVDSGRPVLYETAVAVLDGNERTHWEVLHRYTSRKNASLGHLATIVGLIAGARLSEDNYSGALPSW